jgi:hypothetical protein
MTEASKPRFAQGGTIPPGSMQIIGGSSPNCLSPLPEVGGHPGPKPMAMSILVSPAEQARIEVALHRSYELAVERGHLRRN